MKKHLSLVELKNEYLNLRMLLYQVGFWITPDASLLHVHDMTDKEIAFLLEDFLLRAYTIENDQHKGMEETRRATLERVQLHPLYAHLYHEAEVRKLTVPNDIYWLLTGEAIA